MKIIRTIHPVGQGAFYSEQFMDWKGSRKAMIVYDCGSNNTSGLMTELSSFFNKGDVIDVLFISHFHRDHTNGIKKLLALGVKIDTLVIPLINPADLWFYIYVEDIEPDLVRDPKGYCNARRVIRVRAEGTQATDFGNNGADAMSAEEIKSGETINIPVSNPPDWCYIPYNFEDTKRIQLLELNLPKSINPVKLDTIIIDMDVVREIQNVYRTLCAKSKIAMNETSMMVFSGPLKEGTFFVRKWGTGAVCPQQTCRGTKKMQSGCLYFGDTNLNQKNAGKSLLDYLGSRLGCHVSKVGTVQLPHHGAKGDYDAALFKTFPNGKLCFASFGTDNTYGHPSYLVVESVVENGRFFCGISERRNSGLQAFIQ